MKQNKLLLINLDFVRKIEGQTPLNLAYLAATVEKDAEVKIIDLNVKPRDSLNKILAEFEPTHVGIPRYTPNNIDSINLLKEIHEKYPKIITISGGPHEVFRADITKEQNPWINHVVRDKYGEQALLRIITGNDRAEVDWRTIFPAYHLLNTGEKSYSFDFDLFQGKKMLQYMSARGCGLQCNFCPTGEYEAKDNEVVIEHLKKIIDMGYEALYFNDVNFTANPKRTIELMELMIKGGLNKKLEWGCQTTANELLDDDLIKLMADAGCTYITYSLENVSKEALKKINKKIDPDVVKHKCKVTKKLSIKTGLYIMFGINDDQEKDFEWVQQTLDKVAEIHPDYVSYSILAHYPNLNPDLPYETQRFGTEKVWEFFDEGAGAYHPHCNAKYAKKIRDEVLKRHRTDLKDVKRF